MIPGTPPDRLVHLDLPGVKRVLHRRDLMNRRTFVWEFVVAPRSNGLSRKLSQTRSPTRALGVLLAAVLATIWIAPAMAQDKVVLRLSRDHQAQFAGYYAALWQGFYSGAGLDVEILSPFDGEARVRPDVEVADGRADFGIGGSKILVAIDVGAPLMIASPVFHHTGFGVLARADLRISSPADLNGLRVAKPTSTVSLAELTAMLAAEGIDPETMNWVDSNPGDNGARLINGDIDAFFSFEPASMPVLERAGISITVLRPPTYGVDFYGDALFTSTAVAQSNPDLVSRFVAASLEGWHYAQDHPVEIADRISSDLGSTVPISDLRGFNRSMVADISYLTIHPEVALEHSNPDRWLGMHQALAAAGLVTGPFNYLDAVLDPERRATKARENALRSLAIILAAALVVGLLTWPWTLRRTVKARTKSLAEGESRYALVVQGTDAGIWDWQVQTGEGWVSPRFYELLGYAEGEISADFETLFGQIHPEDMAPAQEMIRQHLEERVPYELDLRMRHKDGHYVWFHSSAQAMWDANGEPQRLAGSVTDITERKHAEEELRRYEVIVASSTDLLALFDKEYRYLAVNSAYLKAFGKTREEVVGHTATEVMGEKAYVEIIKPHGDRCLSGEKVGYQKQFDNLAAGNAFMDVTYNPYFDADNEVKGFVVNARDITERINATAALQEAKDQAEAANQAKGDFLSSMSHELRTPMNAILGFAQILERDASHVLTTQHQEAVDHILTSGDHLLALIDDVLELAQFDSTGLTVSMERIDVSKVIREATSTVRHLAEKADIVFNDNTLRFVLPFIDADRTRLQQALLNLLTNGVKYNVSGGSLTVSVKETRDHYVRIIVSDTGAGIAVERQHELFEPFARLGKENTDIAGTGIGLSITKRLVEAMAGRVGFQSTLGLGSKFWIEFPIADGRLQSLGGDELRGQDPEIVKAGDRTILCVEDSPSGLQLLEALIAGIPGTFLITAHTGELGLDLAELHRPDLILMDINLPGMNGIAARQALRRSPETSDIPVIALTAKASKDDIASGLAAGFEYYFTKPLNVSEVTGAINDLLARA